MYSLLVIGSPAEIAKAMDIWTFGISIVEFFDVEYVDSTCPGSELLGEFAQMLPLQGEPAEFAVVYEWLKGISQHFASVYDAHPTWMDKVPERYHSLLQAMLTRPVGIGSESRSIFNPEQND